MGRSVSLATGAGSAAVTGWPGFSTSHVKKPVEKVFSPSLTLRLATQR